jgi:hypothetical protein
MAFWRSVLPHLDLDAEGFEIETMINIRALRSGLEVVEVPSFEFARKCGEGRLRTFADGWRVLKTIVTERFTRIQTAAPRAPLFDDAPHHLVEETVGTGQTPS